MQTVKPVNLFIELRTQLRDRISEPFIRFEKNFHNVKGGFAVSRVAGSTNVSPPISGFTFKSFGFSGFETSHGLRVWLLLCSGLGYCIQNSFFFGFSKSFGPCSYLRSKSHLSNA